jgi:hypothetical protein
MNKYIDLLEVASDDNPQASTFEPSRHKPR